MFKGLQVGFVRDSNVAGLENPPNGDLLASRCPRPCGPGMEGVARQPGPDHTRSAIMLNIVEPPNFFMGKKR